MNVANIISNERLRKLGPWIGYPAFALFSFLFFLYLTFPVSRLKPRLERQASAELGMDVTIGDLSARPIAGVSAENVNMVSKPTPGALAPRNPDGSPAPQPKPLRIHLDQVVVKVGLLPLLWGGLDLSFWAQGLGGEVEGSFEQKSSKTAAGSATASRFGQPAPRIHDWSLAAELQKINLASVTVIKDTIGLPVTGQLSGKSELVVPEGRWSNANGSIELDLEDGSAGDGKAKLVVQSHPMLKHGLTLTRLRLGRLRGTITIEKGVASVRISSRDKIGEVDVEVDIEGRVTLRNPLPYSSSDLYARFRLSPDLRKRSAAFELLENGLTNARRPDGSYGIQIGGLLRQLQPRMSAVGGAGGGPGGGLPRRRFP